MWEQCHCNNPDCYECSVVQTLETVDDPDVVAYFTHELTVYQTMYVLCGPTMELAVEINLEE